MNKKLRVLAFVGLLALLPVALSACGDSGDESPGASQDGGDDATPEPETAAVAELAVTTEDFEIQFEQDSVPAGLVTITQTNEGKEPHEVQLFKLPDDMPYEEFEEGMLKKGPSILGPEIQPASGPGSSSGTPAGETQQVTLELEEGQYAAVCFVHGHFQKGMIAPFEVTAAEGATAEPPETDGTITLSDYQILLPEDFTGQGTYEISGAGPQPHEFAIYRFDATLEEVNDFLEAGGQGKPPGQGEPEPLPGVSGIAAGSQTYVDVNLEPGVYVFACFIPDAKTQKPHFLLGMHTAFEQK